MTQTDFENTLKRIAAYKREAAALEAKLRPVVDELERLKLEAIAYMQQTNSKRTGAVDGFYLTRVAGRTKKTILDEDAALVWLGELGEFSTDYMKLDEPMVLSRAEKYFKETGEFLPFIEVTQGQEYLSVKQEETK